ncbi:MAG: Mur ligase family protein [Planctomycetaceae bacterium]
MKYDILNEDKGLFFGSCSSHGRRPWLLIGALGAGMRAFAEMLLDAGESVVGTDHELTADECGQTAPGCPQTVRLFHPDHAEQIFANTPGYVVYSMAVPEPCPLLLRSQALGLTPMPLSQALSQFLVSRSLACVAGTHGKTTTSGMIWCILQQAGCNPSAYVGGVMRDQHRSGIFGSGAVAVVESCEYRQSFLHLSPKTIVLTGIEPDHFDCFSSQADCDQTFNDFVARLPRDGTLVFNHDCQRSAAIAATCGRRTVSFSMCEEADWNAIGCASRYAGIPGNSQRQTFLLRNRTHDVGRVQLQIPGLHNRQNAIAAIAAAVATGVSVETAVRGIAAFSGIRRRFEHRGQLFGIDWIDDYAHHPTAIRSTLETARSIFQNRRLIAVFEPHQLSRVSALFEDFRSALSLADECLILPVLPAREKASLAHCSRVSGTLVRSISESGGRAFLTTNLDQVLTRLDHSGRPGDVVVTMGAGRTHQIHDEIHRRLQRNSAA